MGKLYGKALLSSFVAAVLFFDFTALSAIGLLGWGFAGNISFGISWMINSMRLWAVLFFIPSLMVALIAVPLPSAASEGRLRAAIDAGWWGTLYLNPLGLLCVALRLFWREVLLPAYALIAIIHSGFFPKDDAGSEPQA